MKTWLTDTQAGALLGKQASTIARWRRMGLRFTATRPVLIDAEDLDRFLEQRKGSNRRISASFGKSGSITTSRPIADITSSGSTGSALRAATGKARARKTLRRPKSD
jgi:hypothetical protein